MSIILQKEDLIQRFTKGDHKAFDSIHTMYFHRVRTFADSFIPSDAAEDVTEETFVKLWRLRETFYTLDNIRAFLFITTRNSCMDYLRYLLKVKNSQIILSSQPEETTHCDCEQSLSDERMAFIREAARLLTSRQRTVFFLKAYKGHQHSIIGQKLGITTLQSRKLYSRAIQKIRQNIPSRLR